MAYPPEVVRRERRILEIIARGHPDRETKVHTSRATFSARLLEWDEIRTASGVPETKFSDCIAHLIAGNLVDRYVQTPGFLGLLLGKPRQFYLWATEAGLRFLKEHPEENLPEEIQLPELGKLSQDDIVDAVRIYENILSVNPYVEAKEISWATLALDSDVKEEIQVSVDEKEAMWTVFEKRFGHRSAVRSDQEKAVRDPIVVRETVRVFRAVDEQLRRRGFPEAKKPDSWSTHYKNGDVGLPPAPWER